MRHRFYTARRTPFGLISPIMFARLALLVALMIALQAAPITAQEATPFPRIGDVPGTAAGCNELIINGGFELPGAGWQPLTPGLPPELDHAYVSSPVFAGTQALRIGIVEGPNTAITGGVYQTVDLPPQASPIVLSFRYLPRHEPNPGSDLQFLDIVDETTGERTRLWAELANQNTWLFRQEPLTHLQGRRIRIEFGVSNDGGGGRTALYLDQVSLQSCPVTPGPTPTGVTPTPSPTLVIGTPTPTPPIIEINTPTPTLISPFPTETPTPIGITPLPTLTPTPIFATPTPILPATPLPPGCISNIIINGSFEEAIDGGSGWILGNDPVPPRLTGDAAYAGIRSLRLGNPLGPGSRNVKTYSSVRQLITVPHTALTARLHWAHQSFTQAPPDQNVGPGRDRQDVILLTPDLVTMEILYRRLRNDGFWQTESADLTHYIGQTFFIYFNAFDDGDGLRTWMNLDAVRLELCFSVPPTPTFTPSPDEPTPIPLITSDAVERSLPPDEAVRSLAIEAPTDEIRAVEPAQAEENGIDVGALVSRLFSFLASNLLVVGIVIAAIWLFWRFILR
ncbi:MAG: hypothetical protein KF893_15740 [Caldilineaceae bacterium]|nr:hypothetical protein [Caldilineaceae bacterium]